MKVKSKSKKINKAWLNDHVNDPYVRLAQKEGYRSRAAYKLKEIDEALQLIRPGQLVVDLGAVPGAWSQYLRRKFAPKEAGTGGAAVGALNGTIIALDLLEFEPIEAFSSSRVISAKNPFSSNWKRPWAAARSMWWCLTWRPTSVAWKSPMRPGSNT